jgi:hypothetical protein
MTISVRKGVEAIGAEGEDVMPNGLYDETGGNGKPGEGFRQGGLMSGGFCIKWTEVILSIISKIWHIFI